MPLPPDTNRFLDLAQNAEPITSKQAIAIVSAIVLAYLDTLIHFSAEPLLSGLIVWGVVNLVGDLWARAKVWSERSHVAAVQEAYTEGQQDGVQPAAPAPHP